MRSQPLPDKTVAAWPDSGIVTHVAGVIDSISIVISQGQDTAPSLVHTLKLWWPAAGLSLIDQAPPDITCVNPTRTPLSRTYNAALDVPCPKRIKAGLAVVPGFESELHLPSTTRVIASGAET